MIIKLAVLSLYSIVPSCNVKWVVIIINRQDNIAIISYIYPSSLGLATRIMIKLHMSNVIQSLPIHYIDYSALLQSIAEPIMLLSNFLLHKCHVGLIILMCVQSAAWLIKCSVYMSCGFHVSVLCVHVHCEYHVCAECISYKCVGLMWVQSAWVWDVLCVHNYDIWLIYYCDS